MAAPPWPNQWGRLVLHFRCPRTLALFLFLVVVTHVRGDHDDARPFQGHPRNISASVGNITKDIDKCTSKHACNNSVRDDYQRAGGVTVGRSIANNASAGVFSVSNIKAVFDRNLTQCFFRSSVVKCLKLSLLDRLAQLLEVSEKMELNRTMDLMDGMVSLEPVSGEKNDVKGDLVARMKTERERLAVEGKEGEKELDSLLKDGLTKFFEKRSLNLNVIPGYTIRLRSGKSTANYVSMSVKLSGETVAQVAARTMRMGGPFMMLGPMITLGMLPFSLASLNYMVMNAYAMNNMALMNVLWTTIKDHLFEDHGTDVVYRNPGYENEFKMYQHPGYKNEFKMYQHPGYKNEQKKPQPQPPIYQFGKPIIHQGLKASPSVHGHPQLVKVPGPPRPLVHFDPGSLHSGSHMHTHIKSITIPAGDKLRIVHPPTPPNKPKPPAFRFPSQAYLRPQPPRSRPVIPLPRPHSLRITHPPPEILAATQHTVGQNYIKEMNRLQAIHSAYGGHHNFVTDHSNVNHPFGLDQLPSSQYVIHHLVPKPNHQAGIVFHREITHNFPNRNQQDSSPSGHYIQNIQQPNFQSNEVKFRDDTQQNTDEANQNPIIVVHDGHNGIQGEGNNNYFFREENGQIHNPLNNPNIQLPTRVEDHIANDIHILKGGQQHVGHNFVQEEAVVSPSVDDSGPEEPPMIPHTNLTPNSENSEDSWVPKSNGASYRENNDQSWPIVYVDPTTIQHTSSNSISDQTNHDDSKSIQGDEHYYGDLTRGETRYNNPVIQFNVPENNDANDKNNFANGDFVHINFGSKSDYVEGKPPKVNNYNNGNPSVLADPAITFQDSVDLDDKPIPGIGTAERLVQSRHAQVIKPSVHVESPFSPIVVTDKDNQDGKVGDFRPTSLPASNRRSDVGDEFGKDSIWKNNFGQNPGVDRTKQSRQQGENSRKGEIFVSDDDDWKAVNDPKLGYKNHRMDNYRKEATDSKVTKSVPFASRGSFGFVVDDSASDWKSSRTRGSGGHNSTADIIYDDTHDGNWEVDPGFTEEVIVVEVPKEEPLLKPRNNVNKQIRR